jgi:hypothetical protein
MTCNEFFVLAWRRAGIAQRAPVPSRLGVGNYPVNTYAAIDLLIIDETQDFKPDWVQALLQRVRPGGLTLLLEDPEQHLYADREPFGIEHEVVVTSPENFRSPRALVDLCNLLRLTAQPVQAMGPYAGEVSEPIVYGADLCLSEATVAAVQRCLDRGFTLDDVAVLTLRGRASSELLTCDALGPWRLRRFTGDYDVAGNPVWTDGPLLADTVFRFKGQSAQAVVLTECDFANWDEPTRRRLFVGFTRARMHVEWVISQRAAQVVAGMLGTMR